jgi:Mce-associated membrane protein
MGPPREFASAGAGDEEHNDEPVQRAPGEPTRSVPRRRATRIRWLVAAALIAVLTGAAGHVGWQRFHQHQKEVAAQQALAAAEKYVVTLTSLDSNGIDKHVADVLDGSTGEFGDNYAKSTSGQHRQAIIDNKVTTRGWVVESAVKSVTTNKVQVLLMVDQSVNSLASPEPQIDRSRIKMTMQKVGDRWLVSNIELL